MRAGTLPVLFTAESSEPRTVPGMWEALKILTERTVMFRLRTTAVSGSLVVVCVAPSTGTFRSDITYTVAKLLRRTTIKEVVFVRFWKNHARWLECKTLNFSLYSEKQHALNVSFSIFV